MELTVNGKKELLPWETTLAQLIKTKELKPETIVIEHNGEIALKSDWESIILKENDRLEIISFVGGG